MMKKLFLGTLAIASLILVGCDANSRNSNNDSAKVEEVVVDDESPAIVDDFFTKFQEENDGWTKTEEGHQKLVKAFEDEMKSNIDFAKAVASYGTEYQYSNKIRKDDSISSYNKEDGEEGEIKAFEFVIPVKLIKPLYNGQKEIEVSYEIISMIPSTVEEHWRPYVVNANFADTFNPYFKSKRDGVLNLGCYVVTNKAPEK